MMFTLKVARTAGLAALGYAFVACAEPTAPTAPVSSLTQGGGMASAKDEKDNADVHAIHVQITSMVLNAVTIDRFTFHAVRHGDDVKGKFFLYQIRIIDGEEQAVVIASGPMECATVTGNRARVGGLVTHTTFPEGIPEGSEITWSVTDNGKSANADDTASQPLGNDARAYCALGLSYPERPVERGKVQVRD